jgi:phage replication-related protein YjqB (UPF0714/DUF867 family)
MPDEYRSFEVLALVEPDDFEIHLCERHSPIAIIAPHAGGIEVGTSQISLEIAGTDFSSYLFEGKKARDNRTLHITSTNFDEPLCLGLLQRSAFALTVHGERSNDDIVYLGGLHEEARDSLRAALEEQGFTAKEHENPSLQGTSQKNICNKGTLGAGVQLELAKGLRQTLFSSLTPQGLMEPTPRFYQFCAAIRQGLVNL